MKKWLSAFWAGGQIYAYLIAGGVLLGFVVHYNDIKSDRAQYLLERDQAKSDLGAANSTINSLGIQSARQGANEGQKDDADKAIGAVPDSRLWIDSEPIGAAFDWLRDYRAARGEADNDAGDVRLPAQAEDPKPGG